MEKHCSNKGTFFVSKVIFFCLGTKKQPFGLLFVVWDLTIPIRSEGQIAESVSRVSTVSCIFHTIKASFLGKCKHFSGRCQMSSVPFQECLLILP